MQIRKARPAILVLMIVLASFQFSCSTSPSSPAASSHLESQTNPVAEGPSDDPNLVELVPTDSTASELRDVAADQGDPLGYPALIDFAEQKGQTYLSFMERVGAPALNKVAKEGYTVAGGDTVRQRLPFVSEKVRRKAITSAGSEPNLLQLADKLAGKTVTLYTLPNEIMKQGVRRGAFDLSTFFGLMSGGGVAIKYFDWNYAYNVHYGTGEVAEDERTGRSFGASRVRKADDASDKAYLTDLEKFVTSTSELSPFYQTLLQGLLNCDTGAYRKVPDLGQTVLTDFFAVYTAEQARNLMDGRISIHWDAALLEVTLLAAFHSGQDRIQLYFKDPNVAPGLAGSEAFTDVVVNQAPGGEPRSRKRKASLIDYWQFSSSTNPEHKNRSGINITRDQFRRLGRAITAYERQHNRGLVERLDQHLATGRGAPAENIFEQLSRFLINPKTPKKLGAASDVIVRDYLTFLAQVRKDARAISNELTTSR